MIAAIDEENTQTGLTAVLSDICKETRKILAVPITIGIGHSTQDLGMICESYKDAVNALGYKAIVGAGNTIYINDVEPVSRGKLQFDSKDEAELVGAVKFGPQEKIEEVVHKIADKISDAKSISVSARPIC